MRSAEVARESNSIQVGTWTVSPELHRISCERRSCSVRPLVMELLLYLAARQGKVVGTDELLAALWPDKVVTDGTVYNTIAELRSVLATAEDEQSYIETIPKKGYRLVAPVSDLPREPGRDSSAGAHRLRKMSRGKFAALGSAIAVAVVAGVALFGGFDDSTVNVGTEDTPSIRRFTVELPRKMMDLGRLYAPVITSREGDQLFFGGDVDQPAPIRLRRIRSFEVLAVAGTENATGIFTVSPDGKFVAFVDHDDGLIKTVPSEGGVPVTFCDPQGKVWGMAWSTDGRLVFESSSYAGLMQVASPAAEPQRLTFPRDDEVHKQPNFSSDGELIFFTVGDRGSTVRKSDRVAVLSLQSGKQIELLHGSSPVATSNDFLAYYRDRALWVARFDRESFSITTDSVPVAERVHYENHAHYSIAADGTLVYVIDAYLLPRHLVWVDGDGNESRLTKEPLPFITPRISPEGDRVAVIIDSESGADLWLFSLDHGAMTRLTHDESREAMPVWSRDGRFIVYSSNRVDDLFRISADGTNTVEQLTSSPVYQFAYSVSSDSRQIFLSEGLSNTAQLADIAVKTIGTEDRPTKILSSEFNESQPAISPDGRWLAFVSDRSGRPEIYVRPYPDLDRGEVQISVDGGSVPRWMPDGDAIVYLGIDELMITSIMTEPDFRPLETRSVLELDQYAFYDMGNFDISPDGSRFLMVKQLTEDQFPTSRVVIVQNWLHEVARQIAEK